MSSFFTDEYGIEQEDVFHEDSKISEFYETVSKTSFRVYGVTADWGTGKSCFINMWEKHMIQNHLNDSRVIHIDAFASDYVSDPFTMLLGIFGDYLKEKEIPSDETENFFNLAKRIGTAASKALAIAVSGVIKNDFLKDFAINFIDDFSYEKNQNNIDICTELKEQLQTLITKYSSNQQLYIVVDELDRCRPDFALETLERIKHLFSIDGVKFILVYNPSLLSCIIKKKYGCNDFECDNYIRKFVEYEYKFTVDVNFLENYIVSETEKLYNHSSIKEKDYRTIISCSRGIANTLVSFNRTALRDVKQFLPTIRIYCWVNSDNDVGFWLAIAFLKFINKKEFDNLLQYFDENKEQMSSEQTISCPTYLKLMNRFSNKQYTDKAVLGIFENNYRVMRENFNK